MTILVTLAESTPTTLTGALVAGVTGLAAAVVWLAQRLLASKDAHAAKVESLYVQRGEDIERLTTALGGLERHTELLETLATRGKK